LSDTLAVLIEPFSCCLHAVESAPLTGDATVLVLGCGTIGALTLAAVRATGSRCRIVVVAKYEHQRRQARALGADEVIGTGELYDTLPPLVNAETYRPELGRPVLIGGADVCFDCVGSERSIDDALRFTRARGSVILVGMPGIPRGVDWTSIWHKELVVRGAYTSATPTFLRALQMVATLGGPLGQLAIAEFPLARYRQAFDSALHTGRSGVSKTVFRP
jgi:threonine dehydrogenase-like Zn-dependent dehydrogenase